MQETLSFRQIAVKDAFLNSDKNILVQAVAGSGKTTTITHLMASVNEKCTYLAFNKSIKEEYEQKIKEKNLFHCTASTLHSLGVKSLNNFYKRVHVNKNKNWELLKLFKQFHGDLWRKVPKKDEANIIYNLFDINDVSRMFLETDLENIFSIMNEMDKIVNKKDTELLEELWKAFFDIRNQEYCREDGHVTIDFLDMIYLPAVIPNLYIDTSPTYLFIDEAQDLNLVQHVFIDKIISQGHVKKWVAVGDKYQSIYGFSGAYPKSFETFSNKPNTIELPLDICYRCPPSVISHANKIYDVLVPFKEETETCVNSVVYSEIEQKVLEGSLIICRNTTPLIEMYFKLLGSGKKAVLKGEDILGKFSKIVNKNRNKTVQQVARILEKELKEQGQNIATALELGDEKVINEERKRFFILEQDLLNYNLFTEKLCKSPNQSIEDFYKYFLELFNQIPDEHTIVLCTIHKSKGLEADFVYILFEDLIPSPFAKSSQQIEQEKNLIYVARTRARKKLFNIVKSSQN